ncbi:hypothetical protein [Nonomuraea sp. NPDC003201]
MTERRTVELVVATRDDPDPDRQELLWAHTGGGGGNFGVITRFWFRDLPEPPRQVLITNRAWKWSDFNLDTFTRLMTTFGEYFRDHQEPALPSGKLFAMLKLNHAADRRSASQGSGGRGGLLSRPLSPYRPRRPADRRRPLSPRPPHCSIAAMTAAPPAGRERAARTVLRVEVR